MIIFRLFHSPGDRGWFYCLLLDFRLEITSFHSPEASGGARAVGFIATGDGAVGSVRSTRGFTVSVSDSFRD